MPLKPGRDNDCPWLAAKDRVRDRFSTGPEPAKFGPIAAGTDSSPAHLRRQMKRERLARPTVSATLGIEKTVRTGSPVRPVYIRPCSYGTRRVTRNVHPVRGFIFDNVTTRRIIDQALYRPLGRLWAARGESTPPAKPTDGPVDCYCDFPLFIVANFFFFFFLSPPLWGRWVCKPDGTALHVNRRAWAFNIE